MSLRRYRAVEHKIVMTVDVAGAVAGAASSHEVSFRTCWPPDLSLDTSAAAPAAVVRASGAAREVGRCKS